MKPKDLGLGETGSLPKLKVAVIYSDARREYFPTEAQYLSEAEVKGRAEIILKYLKKLNMEAVALPGDIDLPKNLDKHRPDIALNLVDSIYGQEYLSASVPGTLELMKIPYIGAGMIGKSIDTNKFMVLNLLEQWGVTVPKYQIVKDKDDEIDGRLDYPLIVKLNEIHGSVEICQASVCQNEKELWGRIDYLMDTYHQPVLIEEFIMGREITVILLEGMNTKIYAAEKIIETNGTNPYKIMTFEQNWGEEIVYQKYDLPLAVKEQIKTAFDVLKLEDYAKFDLRLDLSGRHYFIDTNANPALGPSETDCAISNVLGLYGISFGEILKRMIKNTLNGCLKNFLPTEV